MRIPKSVAMIVATAMLASGVSLATSISHPTVAQAATVAPDQQAAAIQQVLDDTNAFRAANNLPPLKLNQGINPVAQAWTESMANNEYMEHNPDYGTQIPAGWSLAGENVAQNYAPDTVVTGWEGSPGHRANLLGNFTDIGIGYAVDSSGNGYFTQDFAYYIPFSLSPVTDVSVIGSSPTGFGLTWTAPHVAQGSITGYDVTVSDSNGNPINTISTQGTSVNFSDLNPNTAYSYQVTANATATDGSANSSIPSATGTFTTPHIEYLSQVSEPLNVKVVPSATSLNVTWDTPDTVVGNIADYKVIILKGQQVISTYTTQSTSLNALNLVNGTAYTVRVIVEGVSVDGVNSSSASIDSAAQTVALSTLTNVTAPQSVKAVANSDSQVTVSWVKPAKVTGTLYRYVVVLLGGTYNKTFITDGNTTSQVVTGLPEHTTYTATVYASSVSDSNTMRVNSALVNASATTPWSHASMVGVSAPQNIRYSNPGRTSYRVYWYAPKSITGKLSYYNIRIIGPGANAAFNVTASNRTFTYLRSNSRYTIIVKAIARSANGKNSAVSVGTTSTFVTKR